VYRVLSGNYDDLITLLAIESSSQTSLCGTYILEEATIRIAKVVLKWNYYKPGRSGKAAREKPSLVRVPKDPYAFDIQLQPPHTSEFGLMIYISTHLLIIATS
jgi:hypothetical protein